MGKEKTNSFIELLDNSLFHRILVYWQTRDLSHSEEKLVSVLSVAIFFDKVVYPEELEKAREIIMARVHNKHRTENLLDKIKIRLYEYIQDYTEYMKDREVAFDHVRDDIQLYGLMRDIFEAEGEMSDAEKQAEEFVKKDFEQYWCDEGNESKEYPAPPQKKWKS